MYTTIVKKIFTLCIHVHILVLLTENTCYHILQKDTTTCIYISFLLNYNSNKKKISITNFRSPTGPFLSLCKGNNASNFYAESARLYSPPRKLYSKFTKRLVKFSKLYFFAKHLKFLSLMLLLTISALMVLLLVFYFKSKYYLSDTLLI
jgi:hypothetical protein